MATTAERSSGIQIMREFLPTSPFVAHLGIELVDIAEGQAELSLRFRDESSPPETSSTAALSRR